MVDPVTSATPAVAALAAMTPAAMTELQLTEAIESTLAAAHLACQRGHGHRLRRARLLRAPPEGLHG